MVPTAPSVEVLSPAQAAARHPWPAPYSPGAAGVWRRNLASQVRASLGDLWAQACAAVGLVDGQDRGHATIPGLALATVGSLARAEAGPHSDIDLVLLHDPQRARLDAAALAGLAQHLWYPVWDAGIQLDHSVRTLAECRKVASKDLPAAVGLLDLAHVAGDEQLSAEAASALLTDWRSATRQRLPELIADAAQRAEQFGDLATLLEPELKEARGGLRDAVLIRALVASSLAQRPGSECEQAVSVLLGVRDALALVTGRGTNRLVAPVADEVAQRLGLEGRDELLSQVYEAGRQVASALDVTVRTAQRAARPARRPLTLIRFGKRSAPVVEQLDDGVALVGEETVLAGEVARALAHQASRAQAVEGDPALPLRVALASARSGAPVAVRTRQSLAAWQVPAKPWAQVAARRGAAVQVAEGFSGARSAGVQAASSASMLDLFDELLACGPEFGRVWEDLDLAGLPSRWLPGWEAVRNRPQHNPIHLYTVDRHMVRAAAIIAGLLGDGGATVLAPLGLPVLSTEEAGLLRLAALFHDVGKIAGVHGPAHAAASAERVTPILEVLGVSRSGAEEIRLLLAHHLLLSDLLSHAPTDPGLADVVRDAVGNGAQGMRRLAMLRLLTEADARAAGPRAWTRGRHTRLNHLTAALARALSPTHA